MAFTEVRDGKHVRRNCKLCSELGRKDAKAVNVCTKCGVPLHPNCFVPYHVPTDPRPTYK